MIDKVHIIEIDKLVSSIYQKLENYLQINYKRINCTTFNLTAYW